MKSIVISLATLGVVGAASFAGVTMFSDAAFAQMKCKKSEKYDKKAKKCLPIKKKSAAKVSDPPVIYKSKLCFYITPDVPEAGLRC